MSEKEKKPNMIVGTINLIVYDKKITTYNIMKIEGMRINFIKSLIKSMNLNFYY